MAHVFISYKQTTANRRLVGRMSERLRNAGFEVWVDRQRLRAGQDWRVEIDQAIREALALIVILTPEAVASQYVTYEWAFAMGVGIPVIPILREQTELHPRLIGLHYLDYTMGDSHPWDDLLKRLQEIQGEESPPLEIHE
jgi:hypothetical protein